MGNKEQFEQLCWDCKNATGLCPWSAWHEPIEGWTATPTVIDNMGEKIRSYKITACPMFIKEEERKRICPGDRIKLEILSEVLNVRPRTIKSWSDKKIIKALAQKGLDVDVQHKNVRVIKFLGFKKDK